MNLDGIRKARKAAKITQAELAERIGINRATLSRYETGDIIPPLWQLGKIALALNTTVYEMIGPDWSGIDMSDAFPSDAPAVATPTPSARARLDAAYEKLNDAGQEKAADAVEIIAEVPKYQRTAPQEAPESLPPARESKDTTPASDAPETSSEGK